MFNQPLRFETDERLYKTYVNIQKMQSVQKPK